MEQVQDETLLVDVGANAPAPAAQALEAKHSDYDILQGCPREMTVAGQRVRQRAFVNSEYSSLAQMILVLGFLSTCTSPEDVDAMTLEDIFNNITFQTLHMGPEIHANSLEEFLYKMMDFPSEIVKPKFGEWQITREEFMAFLGLVIEQNNLMKHARIHAKKNLLLMNQVNNLLQSGSPA